MVTKYCEFEPSQHRNKRVALFVFLDEPNDPHPLAICDVCAAKLKKMKPDAIVRERKEQASLEKEKRAAKAAELKAKREAEGDDQSASSSSSGASEAPESNTS
jgi:hypothetical protein